MNYYQRCSSSLIVAALACMACMACMACEDDQRSRPVPAQNAALSQALIFQVPFAQGSIWKGETYPRHNENNPGGYYSVDWTNTQGSSFGQQVCPSADGTVIPVNPDPSGYGNFLKVDHGDGWITLYAHLSEVYVQPGDHVDATRVLGLTGSTGSSTGPHLHYEQRHDGVIQPAVFDGVPFAYPSQALVSHHGERQAPAAAAPVRGDLVTLLLSETGTASTEVHILSRSSGYKDFALHTGTPLEETELSGWAFAMAN
ncbi:MAG: ATP/GTP-binding protein, partial [Myxococcaceae bacterium]|nr:ATP/GTP-binding protein [Myxococcaceae bacterium]